MSEEFKPNLLNLISDYGNARYDQAIGWCRKNELWHEGYEKGEKLIHQIMEQYYVLRKQADCCKCKRNNK